LIKIGLYNTTNFVYLDYSLTLTCLPAGRLEEIPIAIGMYGKQEKGLVKEPSLYV
jgi:hypothetical protein